jgi:hypothetical protein
MEKDTPLSNDQTPHEPDKFKPPSSIIRDRSSRNLGDNENKKQGEKQSLIDRVPILLMK